MEKQEIEGAMWEGEVRHYGVDSVEGVRIIADWSARP